MADSEEIALIAKFCESALATKYMRPSIVLVTPSPDDLPKVDTLTVSKFRLNFHRRSYANAAYQMTIILTAASITPLCDRLFGKMPD